MFGTQKSAAQAYAKVSVETGVAAADPHELIVMLFDGAIAAVQKALHAMQQGDIQNKGLLISKAISIIDSGLHASLDRNAGGEIAENLASLYGYMSHRLLIANLRNDAAMLNEITTLLNDLRSAWCAIKPQMADARPAAKPAGMSQKSSFENFTSRPTGFVTA
jgi:flagellar protein FliS